MLSNAPVTLADEIFVIVLSAPLIVLFVSVCVSLVPTTVPDGIAFWAAEPSIFPEPFDNTKLEAAIPEIVLLSALIVLFVNVWASSKSTSVASETAVLNSASVPVIVLSVKSIVLFVRVAVPEAVKIDEVSAAIVKVFPEIVVFIALPPKTLKVSPFAEIVDTVEESSANFTVPSILVPSPIAV